MYFALQEAIYALALVVSLNYTFDHVDIFSFWLRTLVVLDHRLFTMVTSPLKSPFACQIWISYGGFPFIRLFLLISLMDILSTFLTGQVLHLRGVYLT